MDRRNFLINSLYSSLGLAVKSIPFYLPASISLKSAFAAPAVISDRMLVNVMLAGGPDLRHLFVPPFSSDESSYGYAYWSNRYTSHSIPNLSSAWSSRYNSDYTELTSNGQTFGILSSATWLIDQFNEGNVAIICNAIGTDSRNHSLGQLVQESGNSNSSPTDMAQDGWGGRLADYVNGRVISTSNRVRTFCNMPSNTGNYDNSDVISFKDSRNYGLFSAESLSQDAAAADYRAVMTRALRSYYNAKRANIAAPYNKFTTHEENLRNFGDLINARLETYDTPGVIANLMEASSGLNNTYFGTQIRNLYDAYGCSDILGMRVASLEMGGFDTHKNQKESIENNFNDLFGENGSFDSLTTAFSDNISGANENTVYVFAGEFGRQLKSNGDSGTDHGRGGHVIVVGESVNGGVYGNLTPSSELSSDQGYSQNGADIEGLTSFEAIFGRVSDWVAGESANGTGNDILDRSSIIEESSGILTNLF